MYFHETGRNPEAHDFDFDELMDALLEIKMQDVELESFASRSGRNLEKLESKIDGDPYCKKVDILKEQLSHLKDILKCFEVRDLGSKSCRTDAEDKEGEANVHDEPDSEPRWKWILRLKQQQERKEEILESVIQDIEELRRTVLGEELGRDAVPMDHKHRSSCTVEGTASIERKRHSV